MNTAITSAAAIADNSILMHLGGLANFGMPETCEQVAERRRRAGDSETRPLILVADDESLICRTVVEILRSEGYDAVAVMDGAAAVECAGRTEPKILLVDVMMPGMNGIEAAKKISQAHPGIRVICFSGHAASSELLRDAQAQGHQFEFLSKPIRPEALIKAIRKNRA